MANIVLINPRYEISFWGLEYALPVIGKRATVPVACLPLLAALTPPEHTVTLIDENVESIDYDLCGRADIVGVTGMSVQRLRMKQILGELKRRGCFTVVGGPWVTVQENYFEGLADAIFVGEAEETWPRFLREWARSSHQYRYEQAERTDMTTVPVPRFDLLRMKHYLFGSLQFSRGCPFQCEFCDIIVTFGRRPRIKSSAQIIAELETLLAVGKTACFIVDDNLIGNKKAIKEVLREVIAWQERNGYPMYLSTEASIDLADDAELMQLMVDANFGTVFVGIESPNEASLRETKKFQNVRTGGTLVEKVHRIQDAGLEVTCGMIIGFDNDDQTIFDAQRRFISQSRIATVMVGMLAAIPKTPLHARLAAEGRLDTADTPEFGTNVIPLRFSREEMTRGYVQVLNDLYAPDAYFERLNDLFFHSNFLRSARGSSRHLRRHPLRWLKVKTILLIVAMGYFAKLMAGVPDAWLRRTYRREITRALRVCHEPGALVGYIHKCAAHYHAYTMAKRMGSRQLPVCNSF
jgi:radical SAM superfamily enzyme YgiQ (UPF0313 family)